MKKTFTLKAVFLLLLITSSLYLKAQNLEENTVKRDTTVESFIKPKTVFLELGGPGLALTFNYDTRFADARDKWGYRVGAGYYNTGANWVASVPLQINYLYGLAKQGGSSFAEFGAGTTFVRSHGTTNGVTFQFDNITGFIGTATIGYRYQQENGGINFRIAFVPILYDDGVIAEGGLSVGYTF
ncbi:hypothetical protein KXD93_11080 [Mucilaginibacter sp. BJC16-A38]|uniref:hypothetical protein n=1 Tax=Mucilaginibacter phenanthrenivorans TaxID=1234842 RepID=UPI00215713BB|nr:hypothetical protein [Mucilaginibacter phenanthrenivorans]MCR8558191.1 hypothetical protein [Mucilaginibacter phenanthrenivorans]